MPGNNLSSKSKVSSKIIETSEGKANEEVIEKSTGHRFSVQKDIAIESGYEVYLKIKADECGPEIILAPRYPLFSNYLYNKNRYAIQNIS